ncbi:cell division protein FtsW [Paenibacillus sp. JCM 10914]|nr:cell division protein FtsW [Paenibacillus sp. JCM 10914]
MNSNIRGRPDFLLLFLTVMLVGFGLMMVFSASYPVAILKYDRPWHYVLRQGVFALIGLFVMFIIMGIPFSRWKKASPALLFFSLLALILVLIGGANINGAKRWFVLSGFSIQPAEFAKLSIIVYLSAIISRKGDRIRNFRRGLFPILVMIGIILLLVMKQPDFGTVLIMFFIAVTILFVGGVDLRHLFILFLGLVPIFIYLAMSKSYRLQRITSFLNPFDDPEDSGYQLIQSLYALGHGGLNGTGIGHSVQKLFYLPEAHTDFIFAVIGEELGLLAHRCSSSYFFFLSGEVLLQQSGVMIHSVSCWGWGS